MFDVPPRHPQTWSLRRERSQFLQGAAVIVKPPRLLAIEHRREKMYAVLQQGYLLCHLAVDHYIVSGQPLLAATAAVSPQQDTPWFQGANQRLQQ